MTLLPLGVVAATVRLGHAGGNLGYVVQLAYIWFLMPGQAEESRRDYGVRMVFRREAENWRLVHRQADAQMMQLALQHPSQSAWRGHSCHRSVAWFRPPSLGPEPRYHPKDFVTT
jgi:hypothetical protein